MNYAKDKEIFKKGGQHRTLGVDDFDCLGFRRAGEGGGGCQIGV